MGKKKANVIAFSMEVDVPQHLIDGVAEAAAQRANDLFGLELEDTDILSNGPAMELFTAALREEIQYSVTVIDPYYIEIADKDLKRVLAPELKKAELKWKQEEAERLAAEAANKAEEDRLRKEGRTMAVPLSQANKAEAILRAAGINVKLL